MSTPDPIQPIQQLLSLDTRDPHAFLGAHPTDRGVVIRAWRPGAASVDLIEDGQAPRSLTRVADAGVFELLCPDRRAVFSYRLESRYPDGTVITARDPYAFLPALGPLDEHLIGEGRHLEAYRRLGAHVRTLEGAAGVAFAVWAPAARSVSLVGDWNGWDGRLQPMRAIGSSGLWDLFIPDLAPGARYKYEIHPPSGPMLLKADPYARAAEVPPGTASVIWEPAEKNVSDREQAWRAARQKENPLRRPLSIYEVHLESFRRIPEEGNRPLTYKELGAALGDYVTQLGFTHVELLPVMEHPFGGSWGYQVSGYFAPTSRFGTPDDFRAFVEALHARGIGVILDWVPAHFPRDAFSLGRFDGSALYEHADPRQGEHPDWGTYVFNFGRNEVKNFLLSNALYWIEEMGADGLRVDAVASMLYLDYSRKEGEWIPNQYGGRENLEAVAFLRELNEVVHEKHPGVLLIAEESTSWPGVSRPTYTGGLGFGFKWNMGWMHDTLRYFSHEPVYRRHHHNDLTFVFVYAWSENFILPISHDEVVHGKGSLIDRMPGDRWQKFAGLRALFGFMWAEPGKKLLFMGCEFGQWREWNHEHSLDWHLTGEADHRGLQTLVSDLNSLYRATPALYEADVDHAGFQWIDANAADVNVVAFMRIAPSTQSRILCVCNFSPVVRHGYRVGVPRPGHYRELLNTDSSRYGGGNVGNGGGVTAEPARAHDQPHSICITLPPLAALFFAVPA